MRFIRNIHSHFPRFHPFFFLTVGHVTMPSQKTVEIGMGAKNARKHNNHS